MPAPGPDRDHDPTSTATPTVELLRVGDDLALVQLPHRRQPAVAVQADTLRDLLATAQAAQLATRRGEQEHALDILDRLVEDLAHLDAWAADGPAAGAGEPAPRR